MPKKKHKNKKPKVNPELKGFEINISPLGKINTTYDIDKINDFLNKNVEDKKLKNKK